MVVTTVSVPSRDEAFSDLSPCGVFAVGGLGRVKTALVH